MNGLLPLAFAAGMVAPLNPCGFALLPAYLAQQLTDRPGSGPGARLATALVNGTALAIGFALTLAGAGLAISAGAHPLLAAAPGIGLAVGILLVLLAAATLAGRGPRLRLAARATTSSTGRRGALRWLAFGAGYAAASLSCTLGVLLAVIAQAQAATGITGQAAVFAAYAAGSAALLLTVSAASVLAGAAAGRALRVLTRYHTRITAALLAITGGYLIWYWYPAATGNAATGRTGGIAALSTTASTWITGHTTAITVAAILVVLAALAAVARHRLRSRDTSGRHAAAAQTASLTGYAPAGETDCCTPDRVPQTVPDDDAPPRDRSHGSGHCC